MKTLLLVAAICLFMLSCKKDTKVSSGLFGKWELRRVYGGFSWRDSVYKPGNGNIYQFNRDSTYKLFATGVATKTGIYHYRKNGYDPGGPTKYDEILFDNPTWGEMIVVTGTKLTIGNTWSDGIAADYEKIADQ